jgi:hypothetical protein
MISVIIVSPEAFVNCRQNDFACNLNSGALYSASIHFGSHIYQHNFVLTITNGGLADFGWAFLLQQRGSCLLGGSTVDRQQAYDPQGVCTPEYFSKRKQEHNDDPQL